MKRIYVSFVTTVFVALILTMVAFITRNDMQQMVRMDKPEHEIIRDSSTNGVNDDSEHFN